MAPAAGTVRQRSPQPASSFPLSPLDPVFQDCCKANPFGVDASASQKDMKRSFGLLGHRHGADMHARLIPVRPGSLRD